MSPTLITVSIETVCPDTEYSPPIVPAVLISTALFNATWVGVIKGNSVVYSVVTEFVTWKFCTDRSNT